MGNDPDVARLPNFGNKLQRRRACATQTCFPAQRPLEPWRLLLGRLLGKCCQSSHSFIFPPSLFLRPFSLPSASLVPLVCHSLAPLPSAPRLGHQGSGNASVIHRSHVRKMALDLNKNTTFGAAFAGFAASCLYVLSVSVRMNPLRFPITSNNPTNRHPRLPIVDHI